MNLLDAIIRFLGGITFAIILIALTALFVVAGTFIESATDSHRYASMFTYDSGFFSLLCWGFFINILISALRRWPFKKKHIPFLITHLGLLMILAGMLIKSSYGVQGSMSILEGSASDEIFIADSHALYLEENREVNGARVSNFCTFKNKFPSHSQVSGVNLPDDISITLLNYTPHSNERLNTWIKGDKAYISGSPPFPVHSDIETPKSTEIKLADSFYPWQAMAIKSEDIALQAEKTYVESMEIAIRDNTSGQIYYQGPLQHTFNNDVITPYGTARLKLHFNWTPISGFLDPAINVELQRELGKETITIPLSGEEALLNKSNRKLSSKAPISVDFVRSPLLLFLQDPKADLFFFQFSKDGQIAVEPFRQDNLKKLIVFDEGFQGYSVQTEIPFLNNTEGRDEREAALRHLLAIEMRQASDSLSKNSDLHTLPPPLAMLHKSCAKCGTDFANSTIEFLTAWENSGEWLLTHPLKPMSSELNQTLDNIDWHLLPSDIYRGCLWNAYIFGMIDPLLKKGMDANVAIEKLQWPVNFLKVNNPNISPLEAITLQIFASASQLPDPPMSLAATNYAQLLSAYLRVYEVHPDLLLDHKAISMDQTITLWIASHQLQQEISKSIENSNLISELSENESSLQDIRIAYANFVKELNQELHNQALSPLELKSAVNSFTLLKDSKVPLYSKSTMPAIKLECPLTASHTAIPALKKLENNTPAVLLRVKSNGKEEYLTLGYDRFANRIKWPILNGRFLTRFQPLCQPIPYKVRLRQARQINYPGTQQPYSYECDVVIKDRNGDSIEKTISMNEVHETMDGYRFYLANVFPPQPGEIKRVQIVVNYDPAKYTFTYPGASILSLGIILLFWKRRKK